MVWCTGNPVQYSFPSSELLQASAIYRRIKTTEAGSWFLNFRGPLLQKPKGLCVFGANVIKVTSVRHAYCSNDQFQQREPKSLPVDKRLNKKSGKKEHHLWIKRESAGSGQKAVNLVRIVSGLPNEKEAVYGALDKWTAWEAEFPLIAASKALGILRKRNQWLRIIQVSKWMLARGQGLTMGTYDTLLLAFDMDGRIDEAESLWNMILHIHTRSVSKRLFSRMISLYDHHHMMEKIIEVFADMEEVGVKPDEDTVRRVARAFQKLGQEDKKRLMVKKYQLKWKYMHFNGERVRVRTDVWDG
ncbi:pentatricopeptide repeat-containing protein At4g18975, chloroplastic [Telopea speciosissima]|uniref:pentatricopeptide repeat-containing protein At4g18975, chloroplastic n=1 Tax=Telopea speciosissima TaxID=54955 RepID=UPI001CC37BB1|nr:pentatricopeptide repeat-containing protein At4g18975, chloroplastic [Telopea speciosissima]